MNPSLKSATASSFEVKALLSNLDPFGALEIANHVVPEIVSEVFVFQENRFTIEVPVEILKVISQERFNDIEPLVKGPEIKVYGAEINSPFVCIETLVDGHPHRQVTFEISDGYIFLCIYDQTRKDYLLREFISEFSYSKGTGKLHREYPEQAPTTLEFETGELVAQFFKMMVRVL